MGGGWSEQEAMRESHDLVKSESESNRFLSLGMSLLEGINIQELVEVGLLILTVIRDQIDDSENL